MLTSRVLLPLRHQVESFDIDAFEAAFRFEVVEEDAGEDETGAVVDGVEATVDDGGVAARAAREVGVEQEQARRHCPDLIESGARETA